MLIQIPDSKWTDVCEDVTLRQSINKQVQPKILNKTTTQNYSIQGILTKDQRPYHAKLNDYTLVLYQQSKPCFFIDFNQYPVAIQITKDGFILSLKNDHIFEFTTKEPKNWYFSLNYFITTSNPYELAIPPKFWSTHKIRMQDFEQRAECLDILLFRSKSLPCQLQRMFTNSEYDHVAMLLRNNKQELYVFEANSNDGVCLYSWKSFIQSNFQEYIEQLAFRHLYIRRDLELLIKLQDFIHKNHGKQYSVTLSKLFKKQSIAGVEKDDFFCSELVAACYKQLGLIAGSVSSCQFWPKDFAQGLKIENGELGHEIIIF